MSAREVDCNAWRIQEGAYCYDQAEWKALLRTAKLDTWANQGNLKL